jgi:hypothetical protein
MRLRTVSIFALSMLVWPTSARAGSIVLNNDFNGLNIHYAFDGATYQPIALGSVTMSDGAGLTPELNAPNVFESYCVDIITDIFDAAVGLPEPPATYSADAALMSTWTDPTGQPSPADGNLRAAYLYDKYAETFAADNDVQGRTALQLAIWEVLYETNSPVLSVSTGDTGKFHVSIAGLDPVTDAAQIAGYEAIAARANLLLADVQTANVAASQAAWLQLYVDAPDPNDPAKTIRLDAQDFIGPANTANPVPEPSAGLLLGIGVTGLAAFRSRKSPLCRG